MPLLLTPKQERASQIELWLADGILPSDALPKALDMAWTSDESPHLYGVLNWLHLFKQAGFITDHQGASRPAEPLTVYRGCSHRQRFGFSWTTHLDKARWFAKRFSQYEWGLEPSVYEAVVTPQNVLGMFFEREECEVVVNTYSLRRRGKIRQIETYDHDAIGHADESDADGTRLFFDMQSPTK